MPEAAWDFETRMDERGNDFFNRFPADGVSDTPSAGKRLKKSLPRSSMRVSKSHAASGIRPHRFVAYVRGRHRGRPRTPFRHWHGCGDAPSKPFRKRISPTGNTWNIT